MIPHTHAFVSNALVLGNRPQRLNTLLLSPRDVYDIASASTYAVFWLSKYWKYPDKRKRGDVEVFGGAMAFMWHVFATYDPSVFWYLWFIGGGCHLYSCMLLGAGDREGASNMWVGVNLSGQIALLLLVMDVLAKR